MLPPGVGSGAVKKSCEGCPSAGIFMAAVVARLSQHDLHGCRVQDLTRHQRSQSMDFSDEFTGN
jgi:hypothetical protein